VNGQKSKMINNDRFVMKIVAEKRFILKGQQPSTCIRIMPLVVEIDV